MLATAPQTTQTENPNPASTADTRFNGLTHGAASKELFIRGENPAEFLAMLHDSFRYYRPVTILQSELIKDLTQAQWVVTRRRRIHSEISQQLHADKPSGQDWTDDEMKRLSRFDRYLTNAERSLQRALAAVRNMHLDNIRTSQWKQLHELQKRKFDLQREKFELAKAREKRTSEMHEIRKHVAETKALITSRSAKNAISSPASSSLPAAAIAQTEPRRRLNRPILVPSSLKGVPNSL